MCSRAFGLARNEVLSLPPFGSPPSGGWLPTRIICELHRYHIIRARYESNRMGGGGKKIKWAAEKRGRKRGRGGRKGRVMLPGTGAGRRGLVLSYMYVCVCVCECVHIPDGNRVGIVVFHHDLMRLAHRPVVGGERCLRSCGRPGGRDVAYADG